MAQGTRSGEGKYIGAALTNAVWSAFNFNNSLLSLCGVMTPFIFVNWEGVK